MAALDSGLIDRARPLVVMEDYEYLSPDIPENVRAAVLAGELQAPPLHYPKLNADVLDRLVEALQDTAQAAEAFPAVVRRAYDLKLNELAVMYGMLSAAHNGYDTRFFVESVALYGAPEERMFGYYRRELGKRVRKALAGCTDVRVQAAAERLCPLYEGYGRRTFPWDSINIPPEKIDRGAALTTEEIRDLHYAIIEEAGLSGKIKVEIRPACGKQTFAFRREDAASIIPAQADLNLRKEVPTLARMQALCMHEVVTHGGRYVRGLESQLQLLGYGLDHYLSAEEGYAKYREQQVLGMRWFEVQSSYAAVCLAVGLDGTPRNFATLFPVLCDTGLVGLVDHALYHGLPIDVDDFVKKARAGAWTSTVNVFRGTTGTTPGACFTKGLVYLRGNVDVWKFLKAEPRREPEFWVGKIDPMNPEHGAIAQELGLF